MSDGLKLVKKKEPKTCRITIPASLNQFERYKRIANALSQRNLSCLHDLARERLEQLLDDVEVELKRIS